MCPRQNEKCYEVTCGGNKDGYCNVNTVPREIFTLKFSHEMFVDGKRIKLEEPKICEMSNVDSMCSIAYKNYLIKKLFDGLFELVMEDETYKGVGE